MLATLLLFLSTSQAEIPLPSYIDDVTSRTWIQVNHRIELGEYKEAIELARRFQRQVTEDAGLEYLIGDAWRRQGEDRKAKKYYLRAVSLDPDLTAAWYDLGEVQLVGGDYEAAKQSFTEVDRLLPAGQRGWLGPWRLAEIAAHQQDPAVFETNMKEAIRRGFSFRTIEGLPNWQAFYGDPVMRDSIEKMVTVYGEPSTLDTLRPSEP